MASVPFTQLIQHTFFESLLCSRHREEEGVVTEIEGLTPVIAGGLWGPPEGQLSWSGQRSAEMLEDGVCKEGRGER